MSENIFKKIKRLKEYYMREKGDEPPKNSPLLLENDAPIIDLQLGAKLIDGNIKGARAILQELTTTLPGDLEKIQAAFSIENYRQLRNLAHYLKGGASYCGTPRLKMAASYLDQIIKARGSKEEVHAAYNRLCDEIKAVLLEYEKVKKSSSDESQKPSSNILGNNDY